MSSLTPVAPTYELSPEEAATLTQDLLGVLPLERLPEGARFVSTEIGPGSTYSNVGRYVERVVFEEKFGNTSKVMGDEYGPYESQSRWWLIADLQSGDPVGTLRAIEDDGTIGLKAINDMERPAPLGLSIPSADVYGAYGQPGDKWWEAGTVAVLPRYRGMDHRLVPSTMLYRQLYRNCLDQEVDHVVAIIDKGADAGLAALGTPFTPILGTEVFRYLDSEESRYLRMSVDEIQPAMAAQAGIYAAMDSRTGRFMAGLINSILDGSGRDELHLELPAPAPTIEPLISSRPV